LRIVISVLGPDETEQADLRGGHSPWFATGRHAVGLEVIENLKCDALVVGGGITGSLVAERLTRQGLGVVLIDREFPGHGSTAASTSMLLWEIDRPVTRLTEAYGFERAARAYLASFNAVSGLTSLVLELGLCCDMREKHSLFLAAGSTSKDLLREHQLRKRASLPGEFLDHARLLDVFGIGRAGAIVSPGAADADPLQLARGLLGVAMARGARLFEAEAVEFHPGALGRRSVEERPPDRGAVGGPCHRLCLPAIVQSTIHMVASSWAIATTPQPQNIWKEGALIWEDSKNYLYARTTRAGRIIVGGEDSDQVIEPDARDGLIPEKADILARRLAALWPPASLDIEFRWSGTFGNTSDGLPLIGPVPGAKGVYAAYGYGGNGITFSFLAARLIGELIAGSTPDLAADFALDRDGRSIGR
jgi:glycine/D-amino acid oxidase-like deaminating enzyme